MPLLLLLWQPLKAQNEGVILAVSGRLTTDGRPLLWQNRDSDNPSVKAFAFEGPDYDFIGIIDAEDTSRVWMGLNTAGFGLVGTPAPDLAGRPRADEGTWIKLALGRCGRVEHFEDLLRDSTAAGKGVNANFACFDAYGRALVFEVSHDRFTAFDTENPLQAPEGFLVRSNFSFTGSGSKASGAWRYHRVHELLREALTDSILDLSYLASKVARDLKSTEMDPYPLPYEGSYEDAPAGFAKVDDSINRDSTVCAVLIRGVGPNENARFATLWCFLGQPVCTVALPLWPKSGKVPSQLDGSGEAWVNVVAQRTRDRLYENPDWPEFLNTKTLVSGRSPILPQIEAVEASLFQRVEEQLTQWSREEQVSVRDLLRFQKRVVKEARRQLP